MYRLNLIKINDFSVKYILKGSKLKNDNYYFKLKMMEATLMVKL